MKLTWINIGFTALILLSFFAPSLCDNTDEDSICSSISSPLTESSRKKCMDLTSKLASKNDGFCCFVKVFNNDMSSGTLGEKDVKYSCVKILKGNMENVKKEYGKYYDGISISCSSKLLSQGLIFVIALVLLI